MVGPELLREREDPSRRDDRASRRRPRLRDARGSRRARLGRGDGLEPGRRFAHTFTLAQDPQAPSEVSVEFVDEEGGCTLRHAHGGWTEANSGDRAKFNDWPVLLDRFAQLKQATL